MKSSGSLKKNWLRSRSTIDLPGLWEKLNNPNFKLVEFDQFRFQAGDNAFVLSPKKWIETTHAIGLFSKAGRYGGTYAHRDIAFEFTLRPVLSLRSERRPRTSSRHPILIQA